MADDPVSLIISSGGSVSDAREALEKNSDHDIYSGALRAVIVSDRVENIASVAEMINSEEDFRPSTALFCSSDTIESLASSKQINDFSAGFAADSIIRSLESEGLGVFRSVSDLNYSLLYDGAGIALPHISVKNEIIGIDGYSIFQDAHYRGFINDTAFTCFLHDSSPALKTPYGYAVLKDKNIDVYISEGRLRAIMHFKFETDSAYPSAVEQELITRLKSAVEYEKQTGCDFLELYKQQLTHSRKEFKNLNWKRLIENMEYTLTAEV